MFKKLLKDFNEKNFIVTIEDGYYIIRNKETGKDFYSISCKEKNKETKLISCYNSILTGSK